MQSLSTFVTEALIQPDEIGMPTDGLYRAIERSIDKSSVEREENAKRRKAERDSRLRESEQKTAI